MFCEFSEDLHLDCAQECLGGPESEPYLQDVIWLRFVHGLFLFLWPGFGRISTASRREQAYMKHRPLAPSALMSGAVQQSWGSLINPEDEFDPTMCDPWNGRSRDPKRTHLA